MDIDFREAVKEDIDFIMSSYLKSFRTSFDNTRMTNDVYFHNYSKIINRLMSRCHCLIACDVEDNNHVYGYVIYEVIDDLPVVHYIYVKYVFRLVGIARMLIDRSIGSNHTIVVSHVTKVYDTINKKKERDWHYNPFLRYYENKRS